MRRLFLLLAVLLSAGAAQADNASVGASVQVTDVQLEVDAVLAKSTVTLGGTLSFTVTASKQSPERGKVALTYRVLRGQDTVLEEPDALFLEDVNTIQASLALSSGLQPGKYDLNVEAAYRGRRASDVEKFNARPAARNGQGGIGREELEAVDEGEEEENELEAVDEGEEEENESPFTQAYFNAWLADFLGFFSWLFGGAGGG